MRSTYPINLIRPNIKPIVSINFQMVVQRVRLDHVSIQGVIKVCRLLLDTHVHDGAVFVRSFVELETTLLDSTSPRLDQLGQVLGYLEHV